MKNAPFSSSNSDVLVAAQTCAGIATSTYYGQIGGRFRPCNVKPWLLTLSQNQEVIQPIWSYGPHRQLIHPIGSWCKPLVGWGSSPDGQWKQPRRIDDPPLAKAPHHLPELGQTEPRSGTTSGWLAKSNLGWLIDVWCYVLNDIQTHAYSTNITYSLCHSMFYNFTMLYHTMLVLHSIL